MQLIFREDIDHDVWNWQRAVSAKSHGVEWKQFLPPSITLEEVQDEKFLRGYLNEEFYISGRVSDFRAWLGKNVNTNQIESDLVALMKKPFLSSAVTVYLTTFHRAPYDYNESLFFLFEQKSRERSITTIYHELMHFLFHWHYWDKCRNAGLSDKDIDELKEALTVLLEPILKERGLPSDGGYSVHKELREQLAILYEATPDFPNFIEKAIPLYKESLIK
jgi:hypothetical protein